jgi:dsDNA-binding SOS-regulon protein
VSPCLKQQQQQTNKQKAIKKSPIFEVGKSRKKLLIFLKKKKDFLSLVLREEIKE